MKRPPPSTSSGQLLVVIGVLLTFLTSSGVTAVWLLVNARRDAPTAVAPLVTSAPTNAPLFEAALAVPPVEAKEIAPTAVPAVGALATSVMAMPLPGTPSPIFVTATPTATPDVARLAAASLPSATPTLTTTGTITALLYAYSTSVPRTVEPFRALPAYPAEWPAGRRTLSTSKISFQSVGSGDPQMMEFVTRARPRVVKAVGDFGWLKLVKETSPETITLARVADNNFEWINTLTPSEAAARYIQLHLEQYRANPFVDFWEGWNEPVLASPTERQWYAEFEAERACQMRDLGYRAAVGGFSTGVPEYDQIADFLPALEAAQRCNGLFHLHEYNRPLLMCGVRSDDDDIIPGAPFMQVPAGPLTFRYRFWYELFLKPRGLGGLPLILSEYGIDRVPAIRCEDPRPNDGFTWQDYGEWWVQQGLGVTGAHAYVSQLAWADRELRHDEYVLGVTLFTAGAGSPTNAWHRMDLGDVFVPLAHYVAGQP
jgi:hypothetical protein